MIILAHFMKNTKGSCVNLLRHFERNEGIKEYSNESIDFDKTYLNYNLAPKRGDQLEFINKKCKEHKALNRKDVNVMCNWIVTLPKEIDDEYEERRFFQKTYDFLSEKYGEENVISAYVHKDETTPHIHFAFVPVVFDEKKSKYKISAKECVDRNELKSFHNDFQKYLDNYGFNCSVLNHATSKGNKSIKELKTPLSISEYKFLGIEYPERAILNAKFYSVDSEKYRSLKLTKTEEEYLFKNKNISMNELYSENKDLFSKIFHKNVIKSYMNDEDKYDNFLYSVIDEFKNIKKNPSSTMIEISSLMKLANKHFDKMNEKHRLINSLDINLEEYELCYLKPDFINHLKDAAGMVNLEIEEDTIEILNNKNFSM
ncbi:MobV family relaxase [Fusobacterium sp.]|uniref:MobV family relaxase n=1 Tax=Fusobacterium sp. TaxID=68766 RepID=UPI00344E956A